MATAPAGRTQILEDQTARDAHARMEIQMQVKAGAAVLPHDRI